MNSKTLLIAFCVITLIGEIFATSEEPIIVRSKRQQCRCVKNANGGLTCACAKGGATGAATSSATSTGTNVQYDVPQSSDIANQLTAMQQQTAGHAQARCGCIQIVFQGTPQYNCQCGDQNGNPLPTTTTLAPTTTTTTTSTQAPTTTTTTTTNTTPSPYVSSPTQVPTQTQGNGACNCIMISITSPQTAQYQCQCANQNQPSQQLQMSPPVQTTTDYPPQTNIPGMLPEPSTSTASTTTTSTNSPYYAPIPQASTTFQPSMITMTPPPVYPAAGILASNQEACYCVDPTSNNLSGYCGCKCNCVTLLVSSPNAYCGCPQQTQAQASPVETYDYTQVYQAQPTTTTQAPTLAPETTTQPSYTTSTQIPIMSDATATQYPLTTTCVMYVNVPSSSCSCLPQYDQCAQNVCCLKAKYRSYKKAEETAPSTIDMLMNVLKTIKTKLE